MGLCVFSPFISSSAKSRVLATRVTLLPDLDLVFSLPCELTCFSSTKRGLGAHRRKTGGSSLAGSLRRRSHPFSIYPSSHLLMNILFHSLPSLLHFSWRSWQNYTIRDNHQLPFNDISLLRTRSIVSRQGLARKQRTKERMGRLRRSISKSRVETSACTRVGPIVVGSSTVEFRVTAAFHCALRAAVRFSCFPLTVALRITAELVEASFIFP